MRRVLHRHALQELDSRWLPIAVSFGLTAVVVILRAMHGGPWIDDTMETAPLLIGCAVSGSAAGLCWQWVRMSDEPGIASALSVTVLASFLLFPQAFAWALSPG